MEATIIQDTREQQPWDFTFYGFNQIVDTVKTGDYTILGLEDVVRIERKRSTGELATNLGTKSKQFLAEMERMTEFPHRYIICEFPRIRISEFPKNSGIPKHLMSKIRMNCGYLEMSLAKIQTGYNVQILFANSPQEAEELAVEIFNRVINEINQN